jgi:hypothetical protein
VPPSPRIIGDISSQDHGDKVGRPS